MSSSSNTNSNGDALDEGTVSSYNSDSTAYKSKFVLLIIKLDEEVLHARRLLSCTILFIYLLADFILT